MLLLCLLHILLLSFSPVVERLTIWLIIYNKVTLLEKETFPIPIILSGEGESIATKILAGEDPKEHSADFRLSLSVKW